MNFRQTQSSTLNTSIRCDCPIMLKVVSNKIISLGAGVLSKRVTSLTRCRSITKSSCKLFCSAKEDHAFTTPLPFKKLPFNSVELDAETLPVQDTSEFGSRLYSTLEKCRADGINSIFLRVPMLYSHYIPIAGLYGFQYHRAEKDVAHLLLWLPKNVENNVPIFATHHCGVAGAIVVPDKNGGKILLVKEKNKETWKLPGGYVNLGEEFSDAAVREVFEETGVRSTFSSVLTVRHSHNIQFGRSDIYVICQLSLGLNKDSIQSGQSTEQQMEIIVDQEIENAKWMPLAEFKAVNKHPMLACVADILLADTAGLVESEMPSPVKNRGPFRLYHPKL